MNEDVLDIRFPSGRTELDMNVKLPCTFSKLVMLINTIKLSLNKEENFYKILDHVREKIKECEPFVQKDVKVRKKWRQYCVVLRHIEIEVDKFEFEQEYRERIRKRNERSSK